MRDPSECRADFIEKVGLIGQIEGLPRASGRIFGLLLWEGEAVPFGDVAARLGISRGSVSSGLRLLEDRGVVRRVARPGDRQGWFELMPDPFPALLDVGAARIGRAAAEIAGTLEELPREADARPRIEAYLRFYETMGRCLRGAARELRAER